MGYDFTPIFDIYNFFFQTKMPRTRLKPMTDRAVMVRVGVEILALLLSCIPLMYLYLVLHGEKEPNVRGFFCDDETLKHPFMEEQISVCHQTIKYESEKMSSDSKTYCKTLNVKSYLWSQYIIEIRSSYNYGSRKLSIIHTFALLSE